MINLIIDSGATVSLTPHESDFVGPIRPIRHTTLLGIAGGCDIEGAGTVQYRIPMPDNQDDFILTIKDVLYVPACPSRLLCPRQIHSQSTKSGPLYASFVTDSEGATLVHEGVALRFPYDARTKLPILQAYRIDLPPRSASPDRSIHALASPSTIAAHQAEQQPALDLLDPQAIQLNPTIMAPASPKSDASTSHEHSDDETNAAQPPSNLTGPQRELLDWHIRLGHQDMRVIQRMIVHKSIDAPRRLAKVRDIPMCPACLRGKARQRSHQSQQGVIGASHNAPGKGVSVDHVEAGFPGLLWQYKGLPTNRRYKYFSLYVDHHSRFLYPFFQESKSAAETLKGKHAFEAFAKARGVSIHHIHTDNGVFNSDVFKNDVDAKTQTISFCGVNAHWQNGIIERYNGVICQAARTMLLHAQAKWPGIVTPEFWPFAVQHAVNIYNIMVPQRKHKSPWELFTNSDSPWLSSDFKPLFCPVYILDRRLKEGNHAGKWHQRAELGVYVGHSHQYAGSIPLIWNPVTRLVSPQFHVVFDEKFETVSATTNSSNEEAVLDRLFASSRWSYDDLYPVEQRYFFDELWQSHTPEARERQAERIRRRNVKPKPRLASRGSSVQRTPSSVEVGTQTETDALSESAPSRAPLDEATGPGPPSASLPCPLNSPYEGATAFTDPDNSIAEFESPSKRRRLLDPPVSADDRHQLLRMVTQQAILSQDIYSLDAKAYAAFNFILNEPSFFPRGLVDTSTQTDDPDDALQDAVMACQALVDDNAPLDLAAFAAAIEVSHSAHDGIDCDEGFLNDLEPYVFSAISMANDVLTHSQMLKAFDREQFEEAQEKEIRGLEAKGVFEYVHKSSVPKGKKLLNAVWSYRRKRRPDGTLLKHKARLCVDGSRQVAGEDFTESYAPVVQWSTVRLVMMLSTILGLESRQVDFDQAFTQADLDDDVFMRLPPQWEFDDTDDWCIKLKKNLYGLVQASRNWYKTLQSVLLGMNFRQSAHDPCLFIRDDCIIVLYTDDCCLFSPNASTIEDLIRTLRTEYKLELSDPAPIADFLGIHIERHLDGTLHFTQEGLIDSILRDVGFNERDNRSLLVPARQILHADALGQDRKDSWNYRSVVGKLNFLAQNTRPDISFAVHQCARFCAKPKCLHEKAIKDIVRYLWSTKDKGLILKPSGTLRLDAYCDSDFAGLWHKDNAHLRESVLSRTGYVITLAGAPIHWVSKLQTEIALSTTEAEYIALSTCARELIPLRAILGELLKLGPVTKDDNLDLSDGSTVQCPRLSSTNTPKQPPSIVYEDNAGCVVLANEPDHKSPRTKHIGIKYHHFRDQVRHGTLKVEKVDTRVNWADIFTKPLVSTRFTSLRKLLMGW